MWSDKKEMKDAQCAPTTTLSNQSYAGLAFVAVVQLFCVYSIWRDFIVQLKEMCRLAVACANPIFDVYVVAADIFWQMLPLSLLLCISHFVFVRCSHYYLLPSLFLYFIASERNGNVWCFQCCRRCVVDSSLTTLLVNHTNCNSIFSHLLRVSTFAMNWCVSKQTHTRIEFMVQFRFLVGCRVTSKLCNNCWIGQ